MRFDPSLLVLLALAFFATPERPAPVERVAFARGGFALELPDGWSGPQEVDESRFPSAATYRLRNAAAGPLAGAEVLVVRRTGLNPMLRERWVRGRVPLDLGALRPVEALGGARLAFASGAGFRMAGGGREALVYFTAQGGAYYAVAVAASAAAFADEPDALLAIARSVVFSAAE